MLLLAAIVIPLGLDLYLQVPEENPLTAESIEMGIHEMGRRLFFDRRLSRDGSIACSSCHDPDRAFSDGRAIASGAAQCAGAHQSRLPAILFLGRARFQS